MSQTKRDLARIIGAEVWKTSKDVRDVVWPIRKSDGPDEIEDIMRTCGFRNPGFTNPGLLSG